MLFGSISAAELAGWALERCAAEPDARLELHEGMLGWTLRDQSGAVFVIGREEAEEH
jgi:hypothetical protein